MNVYNVFFEALKSDQALMEHIGNRLYSSTIEVPDEGLKNATVPYVILAFDGLQNDIETKDEDDIDTVGISVWVVEKTDNDALDLMYSLRRIIWHYLDEYPDDGELAAYLPIEKPALRTGKLERDVMKPCSSIILTYSCKVNFTYDEE